MNIFYLDQDIERCVQMHCDKHVVKMMTEYLQLLSTAHRVIDGDPVVGKSDSGRKVTRWIVTDGREEMLHKATHINHPSAIWCRSTLDTYEIGRAHV